MAIVPLPRPLYFGLQSNANRVRNIGDGFWTDWSGAGFTIVTRLELLAMFTTQSSIQPHFVYWQFTATGDLVLGVWINRSPAGLDLLDHWQFQNSALQALVTLSFLNTGQINVHQGLSGPVLVTAPRTVPISAWQFFEIAIHFDDTVGTIHIWQNGALVVAETGLNTAPQAGPVEHFRIHTTSQSGKLELYLADGYIDAASGDNAAWGPGRYFDPPPNADTEEADWSPSSGSDGYAMVDEAQSDGDTTFVESTVPDERSRWQTANISLTGNPRCIWPYAVSRAPEGGTDRIVLSLDSDSQRESSGPLEVPTTPYGTQAWPIPLDPDGDVEWSPASANAAEPGIGHVVAEE